MVGEFSIVLVLMSHNCIRAILLITLHPTFVQRRAMHSLGGLLWLGAKQARLG